MPTIRFLSLLALLFMIWSCSDDSGTAPAPSECASDGDCALGEACSGGRCVVEDPEPDMNPDMPMPAQLCTPCQSDADCGRPEDRCSDLLEGRFCTRDCEVDNTPCPGGATCESIGDALQCVPAGAQCTDCFDPDGDGYGQGPGCDGEDCAPDDLEVNPDAIEVCDEIDNNCDGDTDEGFDLQGSLEHCGGCGQTCAPPNALEAACEAGQCQVVRCGEGRGDCDGDPDNGCEAALRLFFLDDDEDDFGRGDITSQACEAPEGYVEDAGDCDDDDNARHPEAEEVCDGIDNNCNNDVDEGVDAPPADLTMGVCAVATKACDGNGDFIEPDYGLLEGFEPEEISCDGEDNDCDGDTDEGCSACIVPLRFDTVQEAADARCEEILLQEGAPSNFDLTNPPEAVVIRPERGRLTMGAVSIRLDRGQPRQVRFEGVTLQQLTVQSIDQLGTVTLSRIHVIDTESFTSPVTLTGFNITVQDSRFEGNRVTGQNEVGGAMLTTLTPNLRLLRNIFRDNRATHPEPGIVGGALYMEDEETTALIAGNLFEGNTADATEGAGAVVINEGVGDVDFQNNTFVRNTNAENIQASGVQCIEALPEGEFRNNIFWFATGRHILGCAQAPITYSNHENGAPEGTGNLSEDPLFDDTLRLSPGSPCINTGDPSPAFNDIQSNTRNDMGFTGGPFGQLGG